jgi:hypothetical protein
VVKRKKAKKGKAILRALFVIAVVVLMAAATYASYLLVMRLLEEDAVREGFKDSDLRVPEPVTAHNGTDPPPTFIRGGPAFDYSFSISFPVNGTTRKLEAIPGIVGVVNLSMQNTGRTDIYIEDIDISSGWGFSDRVAVDKMVRSMQGRYLRHILLPFPDPAPPSDELEFSLSFDVLIEPLIKDSAWTRRTGVEFGANQIQVNPLSNISGRPDILMNRALIYDRVVPKIEQDLPLLHSLARNISEEDPYTVMDIVNAALYLEDTLEYRSDPSGEDVWSTPSQTMAAGGGDCEDWSALYAGLITVMGGSARIMLNGRHVVCSVYLGSDLSILDPIADRFGADLPLLIYEDELGKWLVVDPQGGPCFGWFPVNTAPTGSPDAGYYIYKYQDAGWAFTDTDILYIVDIYIN